MAADTLMNACPVCGAEESLAAVLGRMVEDDAVRALLRSLFDTTIPVSGKLLAYLQLFKTPKQRLRMDRVAKVLDELVPGIVQGRITVKGRPTLVVPVALWAEAFDATAQAVQRGTLVPPLPDNRYLLSVLVRLTDKPGNAAVMTVAPTPHRDPELVKLDQDAGRPQTARPDLLAVRDRILANKAEPKPAGRGWRRHGIADAPAAGAAPADNGGENP